MGGSADRALSLDVALEWNLKEQHIGTTGWKNLQNTAFPVQIIDTTRLHSSYRSCEHAMRPVHPANPSDPSTAAQKEQLEGQCRLLGGGDHVLFQRMKWINTMLEDGSSLTILAWWSNPSSSSKTVTCPAPKVHH